MADLVDQDRGVADPGRAPVELRLLREDGMKRYVTLGDGRRIGIGRYVAAWKACIELSPNTPIGKGISG